MKQQTTDYGVSADEVYRRMLRAVKPSHAFASRSDGEDVTAWQSRLRTRLLELLAIEGKPRNPAPVRFVESVKFAKFTRKRGYLVAEDGLAVPFYLLEPATPASQPRPLCLCIHGHGPGKSISVGIATTDAARTKLAEGKETHALQAVERGYLVIAPDSRSFGELMFEDEYRKDGYSSCVQMAMRSIQLGRPLNGQRISDIMQLIDYALARGDVDAQRIAITGNSHGGMLSLYSAAVDPRIRLAAPSCYLCTFAASLLSLFHCPCNYIPNIQQICEMSDIAGLIAPRPLLISAGTKDPLFPIDGVRSAFAATQQIYSAAGAEQYLELFEGRHGHRYYNTRTWDFFAENLPIAHPASRNSRP